MSNSVQPNPFGDNPYVSTSPTPNTYQTPYPNNSAVQMIPLLGIFTIVHAILDWILALIGIGSSLAIGFASTQPQFQQQFQKNGNGMSVSFLIGIYVVLGTVTLILGAIRVYAGIMILRRRSRITAIVCSVLGLASVLTCYCAPTSIALTVFTLVLLTSQSVIAEFDKNDASRVIS